MLMSMSAESHLPSSAVRSEAKLTELVISALALSARDRRTPASISQDSRKLASLGVVFNFEELQVPWANRVCRG